MLRCKCKNKVTCGLRSVTRSISPCFTFFGGRSQCLAQMLDFCLGLNFGFEFSCLVSLVDGLMGWVASCTSNVSDRTDNLVPLLCNLLCTHGNKSSSKIKNTYRLLNCTCIPLVFYICHFSRACFTRLHTCVPGYSLPPLLCAHTCNHFQPHICPHICHPVALPNHHYNNVEHTYMPSPKHLHVPRQLPANW